MVILGVASMCVCVSHCLLSFVVFVIGYCKDLHISVVDCCGVCVCVKPCLEGFFAIT